MLLNAKCLPFSPVKYCGQLLHSGSGNLIGIVTGMSLPGWFYCHHRHWLYPGGRGLSDECIWRGGSTDLVWCSRRLRSQVRLVQHAVAAQVDPKDDVAESCPCCKEDTVPPDASGQENLEVATHGCSRMMMHFVMSHFFNYPVWNSMHNVTNDLWLVPNGFLLRQLYRNSFKIVARIVDYTVSFTCEILHNDEKCVSGTGMASFEHY